MFKFIENNEIVLNFFVQLIVAVATSLTVWQSLRSTRILNRLNVEMVLRIMRYTIDHKDYLIVSIANKGERALSISPMSWVMFSHRKAKDGIMMLPGPTEKEMYETKILIPT